MNVVIHVECLRSMTLQCANFLIIELEQISVPMLDEGEKSYIALETIVLTGGVQVMVYVCPHFKGP